MPASTLYLVDTSAWSRAATDSNAAEWMKSLPIRPRSGYAMCIPAYLEYCFMMDVPVKYDEAVRRTSRWPWLASDHAVDGIAKSIQAALQRRGHLRAAGTFDVLIAAYAVHHSSVPGQLVIVVHDDGDYEHIADVEPRLRQMRVPTGARRDPR